MNFTITQGDLRPEETTEAPGIVWMTGKPFDFTPVPDECWVQHAGHWFHVTKSLIAFSPVAVFQSDDGGELTPCPVVGGQQERREGR